MKGFFFLEGMYIFIGLFVLAITLFVTTRPFMPKGAVKKGLFSVLIIIAFFTTLHYIVTKNRMSEVKEAFLSGKEVLCESRANTKVAQSITIAKKYEWELVGDYFKSKNYSRDFFTARCIVK